MSYLTLEVEIDHGRLIPKEPSKLPEKASGLLTILQPDGSGETAVSQLQALAALQKHLGMDATRAADWIEAVQDGRR